ncbi:hypothetical protein N9L83_00485 [Flavobacteriales bacterium]|nr:hypothetical protein [Flavobacteriales bacterium]
MSAFKFLSNTGDHFSATFFDADFAKKVRDRSGYDADTLKARATAISSLSKPYQDFRAKASDPKARAKDRIRAAHYFHGKLLAALGYEADRTHYHELWALDGESVLPVRHVLYRGDEPHLMVLEMQPMVRVGQEEAPGLFDQRYQDEDATAQRYHRSQWEDIFRVPEDQKLSPAVINEVVSALFLQDGHRRPAYVLLCAGNRYFLAEQEKWFRGGYLEFDLDDLFDEGKVERRAYELFDLLLGKAKLAPEADQVLMEQLDEDSHKSAYAVTQDLKAGVVAAVEQLANEAVRYWDTHDCRPDEVDAAKLKDDCLNVVYRLLFLFYAESRGDLGLLPVDDETYVEGYSLELLRELELVPLDSERSRDGHFFHSSLTRLFKLLATGYREQEGETDSFILRRLDSPLFDDARLHYLNAVVIRNEVWQSIIRELSLSQRKKGKARGRISYANLGINQLGSVYESLLAFQGYFADEEQIEVHRKRKGKESSADVVSKDGSHLVPRRRIDDFDGKEVFREEDGTLRTIPEGTFVYRLSGRERAKSASFYTPEVLTQTTVKYALKPILERLDSEGEDRLTASELLDLKILEPAMGAAAFHNEAINQIAEAYLDARQRELQKRIAPDQYREELQKVKAHIAIHNVYGVDLNPTAVQLGQLSLWLNVIHKDMATPFFGYRLGTGNAVVGAWLRAFPEKAYRKVPGDKQSGKKWWEAAPRPMSFHKQAQAAKVLRREGEAYHFLLPDAGMAAAADHKELRARYPEETNRMKEWRKAFTSPLDGEEANMVARLSDAIDGLLADHAEHQRAIHAQTGHALTLFGQQAPPELRLDTFAEKERLVAKRQSAGAPYFKLKMVMDYWCALWYWHPEHAVDLPDRRTWFQDLLNLAEGNNPQGRRGTDVLDTMAAEAKTTDLFDNPRLLEVRTLSDRYKFFHPQLEFIEVFADRGGFDLIVGNPPWVKLEFEESGIVGERRPEVLIRKVLAPDVRKQLAVLMDESEKLSRLYEAELIEHEGTSTFLNAGQNYPLLKGQQTNLYKCILENTFSMLSPQGFSGLVHPESIYDDPKGQRLRKEVYPRLRYHFQFKNELSLFAEVDHHTIYGTHIYGGPQADIGFTSMNNLFHPSTIDGSFVHSGAGQCGGYKVKDEQSGKMVWNINPHRDRIIRITEQELGVMARTFEEDGTDPSVAKLVSVHSQQIISVLQKLSEHEGRVGDLEPFVTVCWDETNAVNAGIIKRSTQTPDVEHYDLIYSGPHFFVGNPLYKTPRSQCILNSDYDTLDLMTLPADYVPRTNYVPAEDLETFTNRIQGIGPTRWIDSYRVCFAKMLNITGERTLQPAILAPRITHTHGVISIQFKDLSTTLAFAGMCSSVVLDFMVKSMGKGNLTTSMFEGLPLDSDSFYADLIMNRMAWLTHVTNLSSSMVELLSKEGRVIDFSLMRGSDKVLFDSHSDFARRWALVEIDVLSAMALGLTLDELILIYNIQFPVLQQNEDDTWYDQNGRIVFTCSKGLPGVGVDRKTWNEIRDMTTGSTTHEVDPDRSEMYGGMERTYVAPFEKRDRVEDYRTAWAYFERELKSES